MQLRAESVMDLAQLIDFMLLLRPDPVIFDDFLFLFDYLLTHFQHLSLVLEFELD